MGDNDKVINITIGDEDSNLVMSENVTCLDVLLGISMLFDRLEPKHRKLLLDHLKPNVFSDFGDGQNPNDRR